MAEQKAVEDVGVHHHFEKGQFVELYDLSKAADLNGEIGVIESFDRQSERYTVELTTNANRMRIKAANLSAFTPYKAVQIQGKGMGLVTTTRLKAGQLIFAEEVAIGFKKTEAFTLQSIVTKYNALDKPQQLRFKALSHHTEQKAENAIITQIYLNNRIENEHCVLDADYMEGLVLTYSLMNHSCIPNTFSFFDHSGKLRVVALSDMAKDEEILLQYLGGFYSYQERQRKLQNTWKFVCRCAVCSKDAAFQRHLDAVYARYNALELTLKSEEVAVQQKIANCLAMIAMLQSKDMIQEPRIILSKLHLFAAQFYIQLKEWQNAVLHLSASIRNDLIFYKEHMQWQDTNIVIKSISNKYLKQNANNKLKEFAHVKGLKIPFVNDKKKSRRKKKP
eukprot:CAMPEP_0197056542 /NCGR_PEP_ID=MMETSP1384-20130603/86621_1 /TAXON_ID=29189 /ORGANISM="Ammonia sp." /LENGTH=391 /DNA_ID=CAMNT_0042490595 /DNA_START=31 /DNA_END=1206 /DNA_ORIENTATION=+